MRGAVCIQGLPWTLQRHHRDHGRGVFPEHVSSNGSWDLKGAYPPYPEHRLEKPLVARMQMRARPSPEPLLSAISGSVCQSKHDKGDRALYFGSQKFENNDWNFLFLSSKGCLSLGR